MNTKRTPTRRHPAALRATLAASVLLLFTVPMARAQITFTKITDSTQGFISFGNPSLNASATLGFYANLTADDFGLFTSDGTTTKTIARSTPTYRAFSPVPSINAAGTLGFRADLSNRDRDEAAGLFTGDGRTPNRTIVQSDGKALINVQEPTINAAGTLGFRGAFPGPNGEGYYTSAGKELTTVALRGSSFGSDTFGFFSAPVINATGTLGFRVTFNSQKNVGLFTGNGGPLTTIALLSDPAFQD